MSGGGKGEKGSPKALRDPSFDHMLAQYRQYNNVLPLIMNVRPFQQGMLQPAAHLLLPQIHVGLGMLQPHFLFGCCFALPSPPGFLGVSTVLPLPKSPLDKFGGLSMTHEAFPTRRPCSVPALNWR